MIFKILKIGDIISWREKCRQLSFIVIAEKQPTLCSRGYFACATGECLAQTKFCDGKQDCYDGSDESNCEGRKRVYQVKFT